MPKAITHDRRLRSARKLLVAFLAETDGLAEKRGPILVQLPPSFAFDRPVVSSFFRLLRSVYDGLVACEPRHATWFSPAVSLLFDRYRISRVAADPARVPEASIPAGWPGLVYFRLHGSPRTYWSRYDEPYIEALAATLASNGAAQEVWCVFDNTAAGAALENAWELREHLEATRAR